MLMQGAVAVTDCTPTGVASPSSSARCRLGLAGGHAGKRRRPRASKRAPTTYISIDAATFRAMVQRVTGADEADLQPLQQDGLGLGLLLPHLGVERFLQAAGHAAPNVTAAPYMPAPPVAAAEQQPLYPMLDSWEEDRGGLSPDWPMKPSRLFVPRPFQFQASLYVPAQH